VGARVDGIAHFGKPTEFTTALIGRLSLTDQKEGWSTQLSASVVRVHH